MSFIPDTCSHWLCCSASTPQEAAKRTIPPWAPLVWLVILSGVALLIANEYLAGSHDWSWLKDGSLFDSNSTNIAKLQLLIPIMGADLLLLAASVWLYCFNKNAREPSAPKKDTVPDSPPALSNSSIPQRTITVMTRSPEGNRGWSSIREHITATTTFAELQARHTQRILPSMKMSYRWVIKEYDDSQADLYAVVKTIDQTTAATEKVWDHYAPPGVGRIFCLIEE